MMLCHPHHGILRIKLFKERESFEEKNYVTLPLRF